MIADLQLGEFIYEQPAIPISNTSSSTRSRWKSRTVRFSWSGARLIMSVLVRRSSRYIQNGSKITSVSWLVTSGAGVIRWRKAVEYLWRCAQPGRASIGIVRKQLPRSRDAVW